MAERVVDLLEAIKVHEQDRRGHVLVLDRLGDRLVKRGPVGQARERVVTGGVLVAGALVDRVVHRHHRREAEWHDRDGVRGGREHDRRYEQHDAARDDDEGQVVAEVAEDRHVLIERDGGADHPGVDQEERAGRDEHGRQLMAGERVKDVQARRDLHGAHGGPGGDHRQRVLTDVEAHAPGGLAGVDVLEDRGDALGDERRSEAAHQEHRHRERRRERQLLVVATPRNLDRQHLAEHDPAREDGKGEGVLEDVGEMSVSQQQGHGDAAGHEGRLTPHPHFR